MTLKDTITQMVSEDYTERFKAEFAQLLIRHEKLEQMIIKYRADKLGFKPSCPVELLEQQLQAMSDYLYCLKIRAEIENIKLEG